MKSCLLALAAVAALSLTAAAHADTIETFTIGGDGTQLTGSFIADISAGTPTFAGTLYIENGAYSFNTATDLIDEAPAADGNYAILIFQNSNSDELLLGINLASADPLNPNVYLLCSSAHTCGTSLFPGIISANNGNIFQPINDGFATITLSATTPEPSSIALLGTGLLALTGVTRRRLFHA
ncbi:MAG: PEP-CTERM sorting domain-containing protein [Acidobacteriota bacterium]